MNEKKFSDEVHIIFESVVDRINEALQKENWNPAYEIAFSVGLRCDIEEALDKTGLQKANTEGQER